MSINMIHEVQELVHYYYGNSVLTVKFLYMVFMTEGFFEVAIESWPDWEGGYLSAVL